MRRGLRFIVLGRESPFGNKLQRQHFLSYVKVIPMKMTYYPDFFKLGTIDVHTQDI